MLVIESFKSTGFLILNKRLIKRFGLIQAVLISNYIDKYVYFLERSKGDEGWFFLTHEQQIKELNISEFLIRKYKKELISLELIKVKRKGIPAKEWININFDKLIEYLGQDLLNFIGQGPQNFTGLYNNNKYNNNKYNKNNIFVHDKKLNNKLSILERNKKYFPISKQLAKIIQSEKNIKHTSKQITQWANSFRQLEESNKIDYERMKNAIDWYESHIGGEYVPVIESGSSFKEKFLKLENAINRAAPTNRFKKNKGFTDLEAIEAEEADIPQQFKNIMK